MLFYNANNLANNWKITDGSVLTTDDPINERISREPLFLPHRRSSPERRHSLLFSAVPRFPLQLSVSSLVLKQLTN